MYILWVIAKLFQWITKINHDEQRTSIRLIRHHERVKVGDVPIYDVLSEAKALAHNVLFEISVFKQKNNIEDYDFKFEADCCKFLDLIGD